MSELLTESTFIISMKAKCRREMNMKYIIPTNKLTFVNIAVMKRDQTVVFVHVEKCEDKKKIEGLTHCLSIWDSNNDVQDTRTRGHEDRRRRVSDIKLNISSNRINRVYVGGGSAEPKVNFC